MMSNRWKMDPWQRVMSVRDEMGEVGGEHGVQRIDVVASRTAPTALCPCRALGVEGRTSATCSTGWIVARPLGSSAVPFTASEISCGASTGSIRREEGRDRARPTETDRLCLRAHLRHFLFLAADAFGLCGRTPPPPPWRVGSESEESDRDSFSGPGQIHEWEFFRQINLAVVSL
jgi:hypothetical protein